MTSIRLTPGRPHRAVNRSRLAYLLGVDLTRVPADGLFAYDPTHNEWRIELHARQHDRDGSCRRVIIRRHSSTPQPDYLDGVMADRVVLPRDPYLGLKPGEGSITISHRYMSDDGLADRLQAAVHRRQALTRLRSF